MKKALFFMLLPLCGCYSPYVRDTYEFHKLIMKAREDQLTKPELSAELGDADSKKVIDGKECWVYWRQQITSYNFIVYTYYPGTKIADTYYSVCFDDDDKISQISTFSAGYGYMTNLPKIIERPIKNTDNN